MTATDGDVVVTASSGAVTGIDAANGRANLTAGGAGNDVTVTGGSLARLGTVTGADAVTVTADAVDIITAAATAGALTLNADAGDLTLVTGTAGTTADLDASGNATVTTLTSGGSTTIDAGLLAGLGTIRSTGGDIAVNAGSIDAGTVTADIGSLTMLARAGQLTLGTGSAGTTATLTKQGTTGELQVTLLDAGGETVIASSTNARLGDVTSDTGNIVVTAAAGEVTGIGTGGRGNLIASADDRDITVTSGTLTRLGTVTAGNDVRVTSGNAGLAGSIDITEATARTGLLALTSFNGDIRLGTGNAATTSNLASNGGGDILVTTSLTSGGDIVIDSDDDTELLLVRSTGGNVSVVATDAANAGTVTAAGSIGVDGASIGFGTATAGTSLDMLARSGQLTLGTGDAGTTATLTKQGATGELQVTTLNSTGNATITSSTNARLGTIASSTADTTVTAANSITGLAAGADFAGADLSADGRVQVRGGSAGLVRLSDVTATRGGVDVEAGTTAGATSRIEILDSVTAGGAYRARAGSIALGGDAGAETQRAVGVVELTALSGAITGGAGLTLQSNSDGSGGETLTMTANGANGSVAFDADSRVLGGTANGSDVTIDTVGKATFGVITATGRTIAISANDLDLLGASATDLAARVTASTVNITNRSDVANATRLGDGPAGTAGFDMTQAEVNRIAANTVTIESGAQNVQIGALALTTAVGSTRLNIQTVGRIDVTGALSAGGSPNTRTVMLGGNANDDLSDVDSRMATVIRVATTSSGGGRLLLGDANLELRSGFIGIGQDDFLTAIGLNPGGTPQSADSVATSFIANPNSSLYNPSDPYSNPTVLTANTLSVTYSDYAVFQNTALPFSPPSGANIGDLSVNGALSLTSTGDSAPNGFAIFGTINGRMGNEAALLGPEVIPLNGVNRNNSRINGCVIGSGGGGCLVSAVGTPNVNVFDARQAAILSTADDLALTFDPVVGTNNEALFSGFSALDPLIEAEEPSCEVDPTDPECLDEEEDTQ